MSNRQGVLAIARELEVDEKKEGAYLWFRCF